MLWLPEYIRKISLPSLVFFTLFLWNGVTYLGYARILPLKVHLRRRYLLFGLICLSLALYSFATFQLYSSTTFKDSLYFDQLQMAALVPTFITFVLFTATYLELPRFYFYRVVPLVTLLFIPFLFWKGMFFQETGAATVFSFLGYSTHVTEADLGPCYYLFLLWTLPHVLYLGWIWFRHLREGHGGWVLPLGFSIFILSAINDVLVAMGVYQFFYILELGFMATTLSMAFQLFKFYVSNMRKLDRKTQEVADLNEELQFLVSSISHDLKAPLISIRGFAGLLQEKGEREPEKRKDFLVRIEENAQHMLALLDDLISFMKVGWVLGEAEPVDLAKVTQEVMTMLATPLAQRNLRIEFPQRWVEIVSSAKGIKQILLNLLQNAMKFSPEGGLVKVGCFREHESIQLWVEDQGPGVPEELREQIFQPFFRHHRQVPGTGMGLAIVKKTAEKLGGKVWLASGYEGGARFCVFLPNQKTRLKADMKRIL